MEKRLIAAIALSLLVLLSWSALAPKSQHIGADSVIKNPTQTGYPVADKQETPSTEAMADTSPDAPKEKTVFYQLDREITFDPLRADIAEVVFKKNREHRLVLKNGLYFDSPSNFKQKAASKEEISFVSEDKNRRITKNFVILNNSNTIELKILVQNLSPRPISVNNRLTLGTLDISNKNSQARYQDVYIGTNEKTFHSSASKTINESSIKFIGLRDQYFCAIIEPLDSDYSGYIKKISNQESEIGIFGSNLNLGPGEQIGHSYKIYLGPQKLKAINEINPEWTGIIYFGIFDFIAQLLLQLLGLFYNIVHNWGWAIIILSVAVFLLLFPLMLKQMKSMKEMQALQPKIEELRKQFKDNPQRLNKEMMELYKVHQVNPLGGCLPLLLQMPIFFALYQALIRSVDLRGADFLWIKDLSSPDQLFVLKNSIPILGNQVNLLPILMAIGMFVQQKISVVKATGDAAQQQKIMSIVMPVMFGVIFYHMPAGLVLYWFVNSTLMLVYQMRLNKQK